MHKTTLLFLAFALALAGCGGGGGGGGGNADPTGNVTLLVTDGVIGEWDEALLEVNAITFIGADGHETHVLDHPEVIDLLALRNVSEVLLHRAILAGTYNKIRLLIERITLVKRDMVTGDVLHTAEPKLPANGKVDLNPRGPIRVRAGEDLVVMIDIDLDKSIHVNETGNGELRFRPVVFIKSGPFDGLVRLFGTVHLTGEQDAFELCKIGQISDADAIFDELDMCVAIAVDTETVATANTTSFFDESASPIDFGDLDENDKASVYGYYQNTNGESLAAEIVAVGDRGTFTTLAGAAASEFDPNTDRFELATRDGVVPVEFSNGAKVFDEDGARTTTDAIEVNHRTEARGAMMDNTPDWLQSFIVFAGPLVTDVTLTGVIDTLPINPPPSVTLVDGNCLTFIDDPLIYRVGEENGVIDESGLMEDDLADATGSSFVNGCLLTETLIVETP